MPTSDLFRRALKRRWWLLLLALAIALGAAAWATSRQEPVYRASTTMAVIPNSQVAGTEDVLRSLDTLERRTVVATFARIPATAATREAAAERLGIDGRQLRGYRLHASVLPNTNIIKLNVEGTDPQRAAALANAAAEVTRRVAGQMYRIYTMHTLEKATPANQPVSPVPARNLLISGLLGLLLGAGGAIAVESLGSTRR